MGNGLYHTAKFILENKGHMILYSGNYYIEIKDGEILQVMRAAYWQGTVLFSKVCTANVVDYNKVFNNDIPTTVLECDDLLDGLWLD